MKTGFSRLEYNFSVNFLLETLSLIVFHLKFVDTKTLFCSALSKHMKLHNIH